MKETLIALIEVIEGRNRLLEYWKIEKTDYREEGETHGGNIQNIRNNRQGWKSR